MQIAWEYPINYVGETLSYPSKSPTAIDSYDIEKADLLIVIENDVPWIPRIQKLEQMQGLYGLILTLSRYICH